MEENNRIVVVVVVTTLIAIAVIVGTILAGGVEINSNNLAIESCHEEGAWLVDSGFGSLNVDCYDPNEREIIRVRK